jgi:hypothetical protein
MRNKAVDEQAENNPLETWLVYHTRIHFSKTYVTWVWMCMNGRDTSPRLFYLRCCFTSPPICILESVLCHPHAPSCEVTETSGAGIRNSRIYRSSSLPKIDNQSPRNFLIGWANSLASAAGSSQACSRRLFVSRPSIDGYWARTAAEGSHTPNAWAIYTKM